MKLPPDVLAKFRAFGREGGLIGGASGGKKAAANMTAEERKERAKKAGSARGKGHPQKSSKPSRSS